MTRSIVLPVNGQSNPMFTLIDPNGEDLHTHLMELNRAHADEEVRKNTGEKLVSELERIRDNITDSGQVNRRDMEEVEATSGVAIESYPIGAFTERKSKTGLTIALEEIDVRRAGFIAAGIVAGLALLYKVVKWFIGRVRSTAGGGGGGGSAKFNGGKSDEEYKKEIEQLESDIAEAEKAQKGLDPEAGLDADGKKKYDDDVARYLDARTIFVEKIMYGNPSYSRAFSQFVPAFMERYAKERQLLESVIEKLKDFSDIEAGEVTEKDLNGLAAISQSMDESGFSMNKWDQYQVFMKACGVSSGGTKTLKEATAELMDRFKKEMEKPSKLRPADIKGQRLKRVNDDIVNSINCLDDQEDSGGFTNHYFYIPQEDLDKGIDELDKTAEEIKKIGEAFREKHKESYGATAVKAMQMMTTIIGQLGQRNTLINFPIMINELIGKEHRKFLNVAREFGSKYVVVTRS